MFEDRELFADFLTTYYTDQEPDRLLLEVEGAFWYLLGSRKPLRKQFTRFIKTSGCFSGRCPLLPLQPALASFHSLDTRDGWREVPAQPRQYRIFTSICCRRREKFRRRAL